MNLILDRLLTLKTGGVLMVIIQPFVYMYSEFILQHEPNAILTSMIVGLGGTGLMLIGISTPQKEK